MKQTEKLVDGHWLPTRLDFLRIGDTIRQFSHGQPVLNRLGQTEWVVSGQSYINEDNERAVRIK